MKIAITAASGNLGSAIIKATTSLLAKENIIGLARTPEKAKHLGIEIRPGDYNDKGMLEASLQSIDTLLLVSGMDAPDKRIEQHRNVIQAAKSAGVKKIVYTSVQGAEENTAFSPVVQSNRQTEKDVCSSGLDWVIGRNGIYIEPDIEYIDNYKKSGGIFNCAGDGLCGYTTRTELAFAYAKMLTEDKHNGLTYNLHGEAISQYQLADYLNSAFGTDLVYKSMSVEEYRAERQAELGDFIGNIIAGIYQGIRLGKSDNVSHYLAAAGREHQTWQSYFSALKASQ
ncbi:NAD(P)-dependent oxidoreductase [Psychrosphaera saromensis]|uniref:NAD(P)-dependent oxidoreductase n=1 Tax=Psychrosphaera saromensis TaxID=716813 RepID=A0A2S7USQ7_9GAMM|nr:SDR family oxidoreductase [Psychrosphaera saromensis]PQJ52977.1 NAD(P)-dependent oxidoreductase [Psychrosphaera saromensis]GHB77466.1 NAD(P)-dependent oxidoreductase [Psychrosphaera saromensis]GLQ12863.1 NAD(P)-dependent oxidoreductase [Psychrosphaera saromensis]